MTAFDAHGQRELREAVQDAVQTGDAAGVWAALQPYLQQRSLSSATQEVYRVGITYYLHFLSEQPGLPETFDSEREFRLWLAGLQRPHVLSPQTVRQYVLGARQLQRALHHNGQPLHHERFSTSRRVGLLPFTSREVGHILAHADVQLQLVILLMCEVGLRPGEVRRVVRGDIDLARKVLVVRNPDREVVLSELLLSFLTAYFEDASMQTVLVTGANVIWERRLKRACTRAGVDCSGRSLHSLRVYAGARLLLQGRSYTEMQYQLGLTSRTNKRRYEAALEALVAADEIPDRPEWSMPGELQYRSRSEVEQSQLDCLWQKGDMALLELLLNRVNGSAVYRKNLFTGWRHFLEWYWGQQQTVQYPDLDTIALYKVALLQRVPPLSRSTISTRLSQARQFLKVISIG